MLIFKEGDSGSYISAVQLALLRAGFNPGKLDGFFGNKTKNALLDFQRAAGLIPDGIVGKNTLETLRQYLVGYAVHTVKPGDSYYKISQIYATDIGGIENANPGVDENRLEIGGKINIPLNFPLVPTNIPINSWLCGLIAEGFTVRYPFIKLTLAGRSVTGKPIIMLSLGKGNKKVFFNASHHANEWITTSLVLKFLEDYAIGITDATYIFGKNSEYTYDTTKLYIIPMVNPDGVDLVTGAIAKDSEEYLDVLRLADNYPSIPFPSGWKANISGVDLNLNYPAMWERAREVKYAAGYTLPGPREFVGQYPLSEPESRTVFEVSGNIGFDITLSFHTQGEEIYWRFADYIPVGGKALGEEMAKVSGYRLTDTGENSDFAGYKDWFIMNYLKPGYTVEAGLGKNPLPITDFDKIYKDVSKIMITALSCYSL